MRTLVFAFILLSPSFAFSAPDKYVAFAMETPVSIHDFILFKTNLEIKDIFEKSAYRHYFDHGENLSFIDYNEKTNQYVLHMKSSIDNDIKIDDVKLYEASKMLILSAKARLGVRGGDNTSFINGKHSSFSKDLGRMCYLKKDKPKNLENEIDKLISIELTLKYENKSIMCSSELLSSDMHCSL